jgi:hypothetical protein
MADISMANTRIVDLRRAAIKAPRFMLPPVCDDDIANPPVLAVPGSFKGHLGTFRANRCPPTPCSSGGRDMHDLVEPDERSVPELQANAGKTAPPARPGG